MTGRFLQAALFLLFLFPALTGQTKATICFLSDCQEPLFFEKLIIHDKGNEEGRDSLFRRLERIHPGYLFLLGDIVSRGSDQEAWKPLDDFLLKLGHGTKVYAIPGNHEYIGSHEGHISSFTSRFGTMGLNGFVVKIDSLAIIMLNSNFKKAGNSAELTRWYKSVTDSLDMDKATSGFIVCDHHAPFSNSKVVGASVPVQESFVPPFETSAKGKLFISGHSHNLELFRSDRGKKYLVAGGGGGLVQELEEKDKRKFKDLLDDKVKPRFFFIRMDIVNGSQYYKACGFTKEMKYLELQLDLN